MSPAENYAGIESPVSPASETTCLNGVGSSLDRSDRSLAGTLEVEQMQKKIHPQYVETNVTCGCGNSFTTRSTRKELKVDICNECHPFYTGKLKYVDTAGRIEKFQSKFAAGSYASLQQSGQKKKPVARPAS